MSRRDNHEGRCAECKLLVEGCICHLVPKIETKTRLVLVIHRDEERKPTNTGQLAARCLVNSRVVVVGDLARPVEPLTFNDVTPVVLFPSADAVPLVDVAANSSRPIALVVPDGTWRQAQKASVRVPGLRDVVKVTIPDGASTEYRLRTERRPRGLATIEAIARAYAILEGADVETQLLSVFRAMVESTLHARGQR